MVRNFLRHDLIVGSCLGVCHQDRCLLSNANKITEGACPFFLSSAPWHAQTMVCFHHGLSLKTKAIGVLLLLATLCACSEHRLSHDLEVYSEKLARVLEQPLPALAGDDRPRLPARRDLQYQLQPINIDLLDFLELGGCELQQAVAEKNSSLGKFAANSVLLAQDVRFIQLSSRCIEQLPENSELGDKLRLAVEQKQRELRLRIWNALFAGPEYREFWQANLRDYPDQIDSRTEFALQDLGRISSNLTEESSADFQAFEHALEILRGGEGGALLESWRLVDAHLNQASAILLARAERRPLCFADMGNPQADIFRNVVLQDFIASIQKDVAVLNRRYYDVIVPLRALEAQFQAIETPEYRLFRQRRNTLLENARQAVEDHVAALRPLMMQCGFLPESN